MALVSDGLSEDLGRPVLAGTVWKKLHEMFDLKAVEDREESIPFSLEVNSLFIYFLKEQHWDLSYLFLFSNNGLFLNLFILFIVF